MGYVLLSKAFGCRKLRAPSCNWHVQRQPVQPQTAGSCCRASAGLIRTQTVPSRSAYRPQFRPRVSARSARSSEAIMATLAPAIIALMTSCAAVHTRGQRQVGFQPSVKHCHPAQRQAQIIRMCSGAGWGQLPRFQCPGRAGKKRLNSTRPLAPALTRREARLGRVVKIGAQFDSQRDMNLLAHIRDQINISLFQSAGWSGSHRWG